MLELCRQILVDTVVLVLDVDCCWLMYLFDVVRTQGLLVGIHLRVRVIQTECDGDLNRIHLTQEIQITIAGGSVVRRKCLPLSEVEMLLARMRDGYDDTTVYVQRTQMPATKKIRTML